MDRLRRLSSGVRARAIALATPRACASKHSWLVPVAVGVLGAAGMAARLFLPHPVGIANNGDAQRLMCQIGADAGADPKPSSRWYFVRLNYVAEQPGTPCNNYPTTQYLPLRLTAWVHQHLLGGHGVIDIREMMVEYCLLVGIVLAVTALLLRRVALLPRIGIVGALFVVLAEAVFADYAGSPYSDTAALWGLLLVAVAGVAVVAREPGQRGAFLVAWAGAVLAIGAKNEMVTLLLPVGLLLGTRRFEIGQLRGRVGARLIPALCVISLAATATWSLTNESHELVETNTAQEITLTIMPMVKDPGDVAVGLGLPRSFGQYSGTNWWGKKQIELDPLFHKYEDRFTQVNLGRYLLKNPDVAARVFAGGARSYWEFRPGGLGSYPMNAGYAPQSEECRVCVIQDFAHDMKWSGFPGVLATWLLFLAATAWLIRTSSPGTRRRGFALTALMLQGSTLVLYTASVYGEGNEVTKHLSVALFAAALTPVWLVAGAVQERTRTTSASKPRLSGTRRADADQDDQPLADAETRSTAG